MYCMYVCVCMCVCMLRDTKQKGATNSPTVWAQRRLHKGGTMEAGPKERPEVC